MKHLLSRALLGLTLSALPVAAQVATNDTPVLTNNVQFAWGSAQANLLKGMWREDYATRLASYRSLTNTMIQRATNGPPALPDAPTLANFSVWASGYFKARAADVVRTEQARRQFAAEQAMKACGIQTLFALGWPYLSPTDKAAQSNLLWLAAASITNAPAP
jgi:hypothetical protein